jgi:hypothetical protein
MINLSVTYQDGREDLVKARPFAIELWERASGQKLFTLADGAGIGDLLRIAYEEKRLSNRDIGKYDEWAATVATVSEAPDPKASEAPQPE